MQIKETGLYLKIILILVIINKIHTKNTFLTPFENKVDIK